MKAEEAQTYIDDYPYIAHPGFTQLSERMETLIFEAPAKVPLELIGDLLEETVLKSLVPLQLERRTHEEALKRKKNAGLDCYDAWESSMVGATASLGGCAIAVAGGTNILGAAAWLVIFTSVVAYTEHTYNNCISQYQN